MGERAKENDKPLQVIVYSEQGRSTGFVVEQILDVVEEAVSARSQASRDGRLWSWPCASQKHQLAAG